MIEYFAPLWNFLDMALLEEVCNWGWLVLFPVYSRPPVYSVRCELLVVPDAVPLFFHVDSSPLEL